MVALKKKIKGKLNVYLEACCGFDLRDSLEKRWVDVHLHFYVHVTEVSVAVIWQYCCTFLEIWRCDLIVDLTCRSELEPSATRWWGQWAESILKLIFSAALCLSFPSTLKLKPKIEFSKVEYEYTISDTYTYLKQKKKKQLLQNGLERKEKIETSLAILFLVTLEC